MPGEEAIGGEVVVVPVGYVESILRAGEPVPSQPDEGAPPATLVFGHRFALALQDVAVGDEILVLTWLHQADRDALVVHPRGDATRPAQGVFTTRSPDRPNPIGLHHTRITAIDGTRVAVDALEVFDGTPVIDVKPVLDAPDRR
jgi:tRNA-Thr(GGU) m(6)t(6)A37 methyltransferase TsaA